ESLVWSDVPLNSGRPAAGTDFSDLVGHGWPTQSAHGWLERSQKAVPAAGLCACAPVRLCACAPVRLCACAPVRLCACAPVRLCANALRYDSLHQTLDGCPGYSVPAIPAIRSSLVRRTTEA